MSRQIANAWDLPIIGRWYIFMALDCPNAVDKGTIASVVDIEDGSSCQLNHLGHHVHRYVALGTYL